MYDNELYALTKNQTSPTTRKTIRPARSPGKFLEPYQSADGGDGIGCVVCGLNRRLDPGPLTNTMKAAFDHPGFAFVHISQRCPHFDPNNFDHKTSTWFSFLKHANGIEPDRRLRQDRSLGA